MKKIITILLLCCLVIYIGGYHLVYALYQCGIKNEMKAYLATHSDTRYGTYLTLSLKNGQVIDPAFSWEEGHEEFRYKGEWYDVATVKNSADSLHICAIKDDRENDLEKGLSAIHRDTHGSSGGSPVSFIKFFSAFYLTDNDPHFFSQAEQVNHQPNPGKVFLPVNGEVNEPPPRS